VGEQQPRDIKASIPESGNNGEISNQLGESKQLLGKISGHLRRANESTAKVEWFVNQLPQSIANLTNRIKELGGGDIENDLAIGQPDSGIKPEIGQSQSIKQQQEQDGGLEI